MVKFERMLETYLAIAPRGFPSFRRALSLWARQKLRIPREFQVNRLSAVAVGNQLWNLT